MGEGEDVEKEGLGSERRNKAGCGKVGVGVGGDGEDRGALLQVLISWSGATLVSGVIGLRRGL